ncbi:acyl-CoA dehydrogenase family protein [Phaeovulum sp.]|uniref:acyl-CoA dehydrogenase family protein n=1 Tax=Phaeovulum sp. TaxID=2934796 RepID=UPI0039E33A9F
MTPRDPIAILPTHEVFNVPIDIGDQDLWADDLALREWAGRLGGPSIISHLAATGKVFGAAEVFEKADQANRHGPELRAFDRQGMRINQVEFHPAYHDLMRLAVSQKVHNFPWAHGGAGGHVGMAALTYMFSQPEGGVMCPMSMTYSVVPALRAAPGVADEWMPRILSTDYDPRDIPAGEKTGALFGMFMTEKQGGSDVRAISTTATPIGTATGMGADYRLHGHKFFCSAPMCDAFLVLARTAGQDLSCFLVPRWRPDGSRNALFIQRIKDKLGNRSNATVEMEFSDVHGRMVGDEGRGIRTIIDMVTGNRMTCAASSAGLMRQALRQALHHTRHRSAFQRRLVDQPLMRAVLADMAIEVEAALALALRVAGAMDNAEKDADAQSIARVGTALAKYWNCKRAPSLVAEALECHGGSGYIEESIMPRLYREAPVNSIWEGSGNVLALDILRALTRTPETLSAVFKELEQARGYNGFLDRAIDDLRADLAMKDGQEGRMRDIGCKMALTLQGALLCQGSAEVADAFCASRLAGRYGGMFGALPQGCALDDIIERIAPES